MEIFIEKKLLINHKVVLRKVNLFVRSKVRRCLFEERYLSDAKVTFEEEKGLLDSMFLITVSGNCQDVIRALVCLRKQLKGAIGEKYWDEVIHNLKRKVQMYEASE